MARKTVTATKNLQCLVVVHFSDGQPPGNWPDHAIQGAFLGANPPLRLR
jgi:hypothetical protein